MASPCLNFSFWDFSIRSRWPYRKKTSAPAPDARAPEASTNETQADQVELSESVVRAIEDAKFDAAKVEALRLAIMEGNYPLDAKRIAENMLDLESMISS